MIDKFRYENVIYDVNDQAVVTVEHDFDDAASIKIAALIVEAVNKVAGWRDD